MLPSNPFLPFDVIPNPFPTTMKTLTIFTSQLPDWNRKLRYLHQDGKWCYLGQMIAQLDKRIIKPPPEKCRFPSDLPFSVPPFSFPLRGAICNTELTIAILRLDYQRLVFSEHERILNELLQPFNLQVEFKHKLPRF